MRRGRISYSKVRAVTRVATPANEQTLLDVALAGTAEHVERIVRGWRCIDCSAEQAEEQRRDASRSLRTWVDDTGMVVVRGRLTPEVGAVLRRALDAACDAARRAPEPDADAEAAGATDEATAAAAGGEQPTLAQRQADAIGVVAEAALAGGLDKGTAGDRYQVVLHVDAAALAEPRDVPAGTPAGSAVGRQRGRGRATSGPRARSRRNAGDGESGVGPFRRRGTARRRRALPHGTPPAPAVAPDGRAVSGCVLRACHRRRTGHAVRGQPDGARRGGGHPCLRGDRAARGVRRRHRHDAPRARRRDPRRRPPHAHHPARPAPGSGSAGPAVPLPGLRQSPHGRPSHRALGRRRADGARQPGAALPAATIVT